jgi:hypothetical protein
MRGLLLAALAAVGFVAAVAARADTPDRPATLPGMPPAQAAAARAIAVTPKSVWSDGEDGAARHLQSGLVCPRRIVGYVRNELSVFDNLGLDVGCNYAAPAHDITLYLTQMQEMSLGALYESAKSALVKTADGHHPALISETTVRSGDLAWSEALYSEDGDIHSGIWMADLRGWMLEYRATYPATDDARTQADLAAITERVQSSAGRQLTLCGKLAPAARTGKLVTNRTQNDSSAMMSALLGGAAMAAAQDSAKTTPAQPVTWCFDQVVRGQDHPLLLWRAVHDDGSDGRMDQISPVTVEAPPQLDIAADDLAAIVDDNKPGTERWVATITDSGKTWVFGYFSARPTADASAKLMSAILSGKAKPLSGYSAHDKSIEIMTGH